MKIKQSEIPELRRRLLESQGSRCAICQKIPARPCLDHNHRTGFVRGVLCSGCNSMEGIIVNRASRSQIDDITSWLRQCASYLDYHKEDKTGIIHCTHKTPEEKKELAKKRRQRRRISK